MPDPMPDPVDPVICALTGSTTDAVGAFSYDINADSWWWSPAVYRIHGVEPGHVVPTALISVHREVEPADPTPTITTAIRSGHRSAAGTGSWTSTGVFAPSSPSVMA